MKSFKNIGLSLFLLACIISTVWYTSCSKDSCKNVSCLNFGSCSAGLCACDSGTGGADCEVVYRQIYANTYTGSTVFVYPKTDTTDTAHADNNNTLVFSYGNDTTFYKMQVIWNDSSKALTFPITISNNSSAGSDFSITSSVNSGNYSLSGSGTISTTQASLNILATNDSTGQVITINLHNFTN